MSGFLTVSGANSRDYEAINNSFDVTSSALNSYFDSSQFLHADRIDN